MLNLLQCQIQFEPSASIPKFGTFLLIFTSWCKIRKRKHFAPMKQLCAELKTKLDPEFGRRWPWSGAISSPLTGFFFSHFWVNLYVSLNSAEYKFRRHSGCFFQNNINICRFYFPYSLTVCRNCIVSLWLCIEKIRLSYDESKLCYMATMPAKRKQANECKYFMQRNLLLKSVKTLQTSPQCKPSENNNTHSDQWSWPKQTSIKTTFESTRKPLATTLEYSETKRWQRNHEKNHHHYRLRWTMKSHTLKNPAQLK